MPTAMAGMNSMGQVDDGSFSKSATAAMSSIAEMYKQAHIADAGGALASQLQMIMNAVAEAEAEYQGAAADSAPAPDGAVPMPGDEMAMDAAGASPDALGDPTQFDPATMAAGPPPESFDQAGSQLETMLAAANARKRP